MTTSTGIRKDFYSRVDSSRSFDMVDPTTQTQHLKQRKER